MEDLTKLPKWAQRKIEALRRDVEHWKRIAQQRVGEGETDTFVWQPVDGDDIPLPKRAAIEFRLTERSRVRVFIREDRDGDRVLDVCGSDPLHVLPVASNVVCIIGGD